MASSSSSAAPCKVGESTDVSAPAPRRRRPGGRARRSIAGALVAGAALAGVAAPSTAVAQEESTTDARLEGYSTKVELDKSGTALTWMAFLALAVVGCSALFKDAKRNQ